MIVILKILAALHLVSKEIFPACVGVVKRRRKNNVHIPRPEYFGPPLSQRFTSHRIAYKSQEGFASE